MERRSVEAIVQALNDAKVRYLVVDGLAVVAHGYVRFTADTLAEKLEWLESAHRLARHLMRPDQVARTLFDDPQKLTPRDE